MKKTILHLLIAACLALALDPINIQNTYVDRQILTHDHLNSDNDSCVNWSSRFKDSMDIEFPRFTDFTSHDSVLSFIAMDTCSVSVFIGNASINDTLTLNSKLITYDTIVTRNSDGDSLWIINHSQSATGTIFGYSKAGMQLMQGEPNSIMVIGTKNAKDLVFGVNNTKFMWIDESANDLNIIGDVWVDGVLEPDSLSVTNGAEVLGDFETIGHIDCNDTVFADDCIRSEDDMYVADSIYIGDDIDINDDAYIGDSLYVGDDIEVNDDVFIGDSLYVEDDIEVNDDVFVNDSLYVGDDIEVEDDVFVGDSLYVEDDIEINDDVFINDSLHINGSSETNGPMILGASLKLRTDQITLSSDGTLTLPDTLPPHIAVYNNAFPLDTLDSISLGESNVYRILILQGNPSGDVLVRSGEKNIYLNQNGEFWLDSWKDILVLLGGNSEWREISRSSN
jgi:acetyltransferase-like isoleucine patch superfamily enzyme